MKRLIKLMLLAIVSVSFCACNNEDDPGEYIDDRTPPYKFTFIVSDQAGNDFLTEDNYKLLEGKVKVTFHGTDYVLYDSLKDINQNNDELTTQAKKGEMWYFYIGKSTLISGGYRYYLYFGHFQPFTVYQNEPMTITWPDGTVDNITFTWNQDKSIEQSTLNGEMTEYYGYFFLKKDVKAWNLGF